MTGVISDPGAVLVGGGQNAKYVKECKELFLANKGIEKLRGFKPFVNLESLWLNGNKLKKINNLDSNFRIKSLYAHDNQICTLKGSLLCFKFLETLDLSNNQLRDLDKLIKVLEKFKFLRNLNLAGNPCCEEPDYRLTVVHHMPSLEVLDQHKVTHQERHKAKALIGGDVQALTVAFLQRVPTWDPTLTERVPVRSALEQELAKEAGTIRDVQAAKKYDSETALFRHNPHPDIPRGRTLPPNAGMQRAQEIMAAADAYAQHAAERTRGGLARGLLGGGRASTFTSFASGAHSHGADNVIRSLSGAPFTTQQALSRQTTAKSGFSLSLKTAFSMPHTFGGARTSPPPSPHEANSPYVPKDDLVLYNCRPGNSELTQQLLSTQRMYNAFPMGTIRFDAEKYSSWVRQRLYGQEPWQLSKADIKI